MLGVVIIGAALADFVSPYDPTALDLGGQFQPPVWISGGGPAHVFGTDQFGRDILTRVLFGARVSLAIGLCAVLVSGSLGTLAGLAAGMAGGWKDDVIMRLADIQLAIPFLVLSLAVIAVIGPGLTNVILVLGAAGWVTYARVVRGEVLRLRTNEFVTAARTVGASPMRVAMRHVLPNAFPVVIIVGALEVAKMILAEAGLSFLGLGIQPPTPSWGGMVAEGLDYAQQAWWQSLIPGCAIAWTLLGLNVIAEWVHEVLDPRRRAA